jgi:hypothetical protein
MYKNSILNNLFIFKYIVKLQWVAVCIFLHVIWKKIELTALGPRWDINLLDVPNLGIPSKILDQNVAFWSMGCFIYVWWMTKQYCNGVGINMPRDGGGAKKNVKTR